MDVVREDMKLDSKKVEDTAYVLGSGLRMDAPVLQWVVTTMIKYTKALRGL